MCRVCIGTVVGSCQFYVQSRACHAEAEEVFGKKTPWDSVLKLQDLMKKAQRDPDTIDWILTCVNDLVMNKLVGKDELTGPAMTGKSKGGKGTNLPRFFT